MGGSGFGVFLDLFDFDFYKEWVDLERVIVEKVGSASAKFLKVAVVIKKVDAKEKKVHHKNKKSRSKSRLIEKK